MISNRFLGLAGASLVLALGIGASAAALPADPLADMGKDASAVLNLNSDATLLLIETDHGVKAPRTLKVGDEYRDGWKITALAARSATLSKGGTTRLVILTGLPQVAPEPPPPAPTVAQAAALPDPNPALTAAVAAGDIRKVMAMQHSGMDMVHAEQAKGNLPKDLDPSIKGLNMNTNGDLSVYFPVPGQTLHSMDDEIVIDSVGPDWVQMQPNGALSTPEARAASNERQRAIFAGEVTRNFGDPIPTQAETTAPPPTSR